MAPHISLLPMAARVFSDSEEELFQELDDASDIDALVDALFPDELTKVGPKG
jgi:hypothetical protein